MTDKDYLAVYKVKPCLEGLPRAEITDTPSCQLELQVLARRNSWACWASEVKLYPDEKRVDYVDFCPYPSISSTSVGSIERGTFRFFEVKSCIDDLKSGNGTNWEGDENWLVCPVEMVEEMRVKQLSIGHRGVCRLAYGQRRNGSVGFVRLDEPMYGGFRKRSAVELLYAMTRAGVRRGRESHMLRDKSTCRNMSEYANVFVCSECGYDYDFVTDPYNGPSFCPRCGRRIEEARQ